MANNRELSQLGSIVSVDDSNRTLGLGASVGIGTTVADYQLDVNGDINFEGDLYQRGQLFTSGVGIGSDGVNSQTGITTYRVGVGFTDIMFVGTGLSITGYGSTVVVDLGDISAASAGQGGDDVIRLAIAFG
mgnify:CR=1 FL=1|jgi:hypothetical protein|tara:strand:- start:95 stop:490 length:396 start_codon:yes stop_codon:yes gene_type:complete